MRLTDVCAWPSLCPGTAGGLISPQRALAKKAPPVEVEDLDEVQLPQIARPMPTVAQT